MKPTEESETNKNIFIRHNEGQSDLFFPKHYLLLEVEKLEVSIRHFFEYGTISKDDFEYLEITLKMLKKLLTIHLKPSKEVESEVHRKMWSYGKEHLRFYKHSNTQQPSLFDIQKPLPITGEIVVSGLTESLKALRPKEHEKSELKFPHKIPAGTHWNQIIIKFLNDEQVEIYVKRQKHVTDYKEMGMVVKGKIPTPSEQWLFLKVLAQFNGELTIRDPEAKDKYKKQKQALTESLRNYFSIDYDPFYPYQSSFEKGGNSYKIKLLLIPNKKRNNDREVRNDDNDPLGIKEFLTETSTQQKFF